MTCEELRDHYDLFVLGLAEEQEASEIREHLNRECQACASGVKDARELASLMAAAAPAESPRPELRNRIVASVGGAIPAKSRWRWPIAWAAASICAAAAAVYLGVRLQQESDLASRFESDLRQQTAESNRLTADNSRLRDAFAMVNAAGTVEASFGNGPSGKVFVNAERGILLIASRLPAAPPGKTYEMWVVPKRGNPAPSGLFQSAMDGNAVHFEPGPIDIAAAGAVAVTLENQGGSQTPTLPILFAAVLPTGPGRGAPQ